MVGHNGKQHCMCAGLTSEITVLNFETKSIKLHFKAEKLQKIQHPKVTEKSLCFRKIQKISEAT